METVISWVFSSSDFYSPSKKQQGNHQQAFSMERARGSPGAAAGTASGTCTHGEHHWERGGRHCRSDPAPPFPRGVGRAEQMAGRQQAARSRSGGALQPHHVGWAPGQHQQAELSKYLQPFPGQRWGLHHGGELADSVKPGNQRLPSLLPERMPYPAPLLTPRASIPCSAPAYVAAHVSRQTPQLGLMPEGNGPS